jgi:hypothetical protein
MRLTAPRAEEAWEIEGTDSLPRARVTDRVRADDRGMGSARERRSFSGDREHDELGSEMEDDRATEDSDDMSMDDGLGGPDRHER